MHPKEGETTIEYEGDITKTLAADQVILIKPEERYSYIAN